MQPALVDAMDADVLVGWAARGFELSIAAALLLLVIEGLRPQVPARAATARRWLANVALLVGARLAAQWLPQLSLFAAAALAEHHRLGVFHWLDIPVTIAAALGFLAMDLAETVVHWLEHRWAWLWRIHRVHHSDPDVDVTTTYRFHPLEILLRALSQVATVLALGVPAIAVLGFTLLSMFVAVLSHANLRLPRPLERVLGWLVITPAIHRTHHSAEAEDSSRNFGVCLSVWDRMFGTFRSSPRRGFGRVRFGVEGRDERQATSILRLVADPFRGDGARLTLRTSR